MQYSKNTKESLKVVEEFINDELAKRCFPRLKSFKLEDGKFKLESEYFNTIPSIFKKVKVVDFGGSLMDGGDFFISIYVSTETFDGGSNGTKLFLVQGRIIDNGVSVKLG